MAVLGETPKFDAEKRRSFKRVSYDSRWLRQRRFWFPLIIAAVLVLVGLGSHITVEKAMKDMLAAKLETILAADVTGLVIWLDSQKQVVEELVQEPEIATAIRHLAGLKTSGQSPQQREKDVLSRRKVQKMLGPVCRRHGYADFLIINRKGIILGASEGAYLGKPFAPHHPDIMNQVLSDRPVITRPFRFDLPIPDDQGTLKTGRPVIMVAAPVYGPEGVVAAVLAFLIRPERDFTGILTKGRPGMSGETYAFDGKGMMISQSRFEDQLRNVGLLSKDPHIHSILNVEIRDPGGSLLEGYRPKPRSEQPLTVMAKSAVGGEDGINVNGYRDYRGVPVIGAWIWLKEYGFGVVTELDVSEAFRPLRILRYVFGLLFGLLLIATLGVLFSSRIISALHLRMERLGQYTLERKLGRGGMGAVYLAQHAMLRRPTALKILRPEKINQEALARFEREVQITSQLTHLNTIRIFDYGRTPDGTFYYAMEYLPGVNLHTLVNKTGVLPESRVIHILLQICASLNEAHNVGLIHRDIKPENLIIYERGGDYDMVKVLDFGLVKYAATGDESSGSGSELPAGTPQYLSPEAIQDPSEIDGRADLYSVAAVAYFLLTGEDVFPGKSPIDICRKQINDTPEPPSKRLGKPVSADLESVLLKCLAKDPNDRPGDAMALIRELERCRDSGKWTYEAAKAWWDEIGDSLVQEELLSGERPKVSESMMSVDLKGRERG